MGEDEILEQFGIEFAIENIASLISKKIDEYKINKNEKIEFELSELLKDKEKIYQNDKDVIKKYFRGNGGK